MERKIDFRESWHIILGGAELNLRIWGAKNYFQGTEEFSFMDLGRLMNYFQGSREHRPHWRASLLTEHNLEFLSLKGGCTGSSESILVKMPRCWKSPVAAYSEKYCSSRPIE